MVQTTFYSKAQYGLYLRQAFSEMLKHGSFNIFLHNVTNAYPNALHPVSEKEDVLSKVKSIIDNGLNLDGNQERCPYGSINGTAKFLGEPESLNVEDIIDYSFVCNSRYVNTIIIAIPKYIRVGDSMHEFSSFGGKMPHENRHTKDCLLDISKGRYLPPEFTLGYQLVDRKTGNVKFWLNDRHISMLSRAEQDRIMSVFSKTITNVVTDCHTKYHVKSLEEVFGVETQKHLALLEDYFNDI